MKIYSLLFCLFFVSCGDIKKAPVNTLLTPGTYLTETKEWRIHTSDDYSKAYLLFRDQKATFHFHFPFYESSSRRVEVYIDDNNNPWIIDGHKCYIVTIIEPEIGNDYPELYELDTWKGQVPSSVRERLQL